MSEQILSGDILKNFSLKTTKLEMIGMREWCKSTKKTIVHSPTATIIRYTADCITAHDLRAMLIVLAMDLNKVRSELNAAREMLASLIGEKQ